MREIRSLREALAALECFALDCAEPMHICKQPPEKPDPPAEPTSAILLPPAEGERPTDR